MKAHWPLPFNTSKHEPMRNVKALSLEHQRQVAKQVREDPVLVELLAQVKAEFGELKGFGFKRK